uniref:Pre-mRNA-splicing factor 38 n=1 Tax=Populus trichocarpa TaxID=3694 RepID=A0A3N7EVV9_POPTR
MELDHLGGTYGGNRKPTPFMCLITKVLQIQPEKDIVVEFIKYVRVLGAFYLRLTGTDIDVYRYLEPLYNDYRKLRQKLTDGNGLLKHLVHLKLQSVCWKMILKRRKSERRMSNLMD